MMNLPPQYFKLNYAPLRGRDWIKSIPAEERQALARYAFACSDYGRKGGRVRATKALRDERGRFLPKANKKESQ